MSHALTKQIKKELQAFAAAITPPDHTPGAQPGKALTAEEMQQRYGITTDRAGNPLKAGQLYLAKDLPAVNHQRRLQRAFEVGGWDQVERYLLPYRTPAAIARQAAEAAAAAPAPAAAEPQVQAWIDEAGPVCPAVCGAEAGFHVCPCTNACR